MAKLLTAKEARNLAGVADEQYVDECVERLLTTIRGIVTSSTLKGNQKRSCATGRQHSIDSDLWINGGYGQTQNWKLAKKKLEELGYEVSFFYEERQFVDMYTLIKW